MLTEVDPRDVRFTQGNVGVKFKPPHEDTRIDDAVNKIVIGEWHPSKFPVIRVVKYSGHLWSLDNRRLWVFRKAKIRSITVNVTNSLKHPRFVTMLENPQFMLMTGSKSYFPRVRGKVTLKPRQPAPESISVPGAGWQSTVKPDFLDEMPNFPSEHSTSRPDDHGRNVPPVDPIVEAIEGVKRLVTSVWDCFRA